MAADQGYYYGWEVEVRLAIEATYGTASIVAGEYIHPAYVRGFGFNLNESTELIYTAANTYRMGHGDEVKGPKLVTAKLDFWMADDFATSGKEPLLIKLPIDKYNSTSAGTFTFPETAGNFPGNSIYGSYSLMPFSIEYLWNKTGSIRRRVITGCYVNRQTFKAEKGEKCLWSWEIVGQNITTVATAAVGTGAKVVFAPLDWSSVAVQWKGEDDSLSSHTGLTSIEFTIDNSLVPLMDLSLTTGLRAPSNFLIEKRSVTGTMTWYKKTTTGQKWSEIVFSSTSGQTTPDNTVQLGQIRVDVNSKISAAKYLRYDLYDVILGELPEEIDFAKLTEITLPFSSRYLQGTIVTNNTVSLWTSWDSQAAA